MSLIQAAFLGIMQGLTEFLPVSSSGHLALFQKIFNIQTPTIFFDAILHLGTLFAVVFYLRKEILDILKTIKQKQTLKLVFLVILGTIPAVIAGLFLKDRMEEIFANMSLVAISFLITSVILFVTYFFKNPQKYISGMNWFDALFIGVFQAIAILPGVSRSGSTISASVFRNLKREDAFKFSFLLAIPAIFGAFALQMAKLDFKVLNGNLGINLVGFIFSLIFGFLSLKIVEKALIKGKFHYFAVYCLVLGVIMLIFFH